MQKSKQSEPKNKEPFGFYESSGNIFKDLGYSDQEAASLTLRSELMLADLCQGSIDKFSVETLIDWLDKLGKEVRVTITNKRKAA
jgi:predicted XRE-type DNA-binding protein